MYVYGRSGLMIEWDPTLATGVTEIDRQHRELFSRINGLFDACKSGEGRDEAEKMLLFLESYVIEHFSYEEASMISTGYPHYLTHRTAHEKFRNDIEDLKKLFAAEGATSLFVVRINKKVVGWLTQHIKRVDREYGLFLGESPG